MFVLPGRDVSEIKLNKNGHLTTKKYQTETKSYKL